MSTRLDARQSELRAALGMVGSAANDTLDTIFPKIDSEMAKAFEDRNLLLVSDGTITMPAAGTSVTFSSNLRLHINSQVAGGAPTVIDLASTTRTLSANLRMIYAVINRTGGTATVTDDSATLPAQTSANQEIVLIAKRVDAADGTKRVYFRNGFALSAGQTARFGQGGTVFADEFAIADSTDTTKKLIASASGNSTASTLTLASAVTANRTLTFPDLTDTLVSRTNTEALTNKQVGFSSSNDTATGSNATLSAFTSGVIRLTSGTLVSMSGIPAAASAVFVIIENKTGNIISIVNEETGTTAANRILTGSGSNVTMQNNATFAFTYDVTAARWQLTGGSGSGSGGGGGKNYLSPIVTSQSATPNVGNGDIETGSTTGFSLGTATLTNNLPTGAPTFGSGASGNLSLSAITSDRLAGNYSLSYASSAATTAGNFVATDAFYIDTEDQAKVLTFKIAYKAQTNPTNGNFSGTASNSFGVAIYDVTNSAWIIPAGVFNFVQGSGVGYSTGTFQTSATGTQYRLAIFNANASSGAITMYFDDFSVGPQITAAGSAMSDWTAYTPTIGGLGTVTGTTFSWRRNGDVLQVMGRWTNGTVAGSYATISLPSGLSINTARFRSATTTADRIGTWAHNNAANEFGNLLTYTIAAPSTTDVYFGTSTTVNQMLVPNFGNNIMASNDVVSVTFEVPIAGWSSQTVMSADTDTRVVSMQISQASPTWSGSGSFSLVRFTSAASKDTHASYSTATGLYTVPVSGDYRVSAAFSIGGTWALNNKAEIIVYKNGSAVNIQGSVFAGGAVSVVAPAISGTVPCAAGDTLALYALANNTGPVANGNAPNNFLHIDRLSGPATIAASESVSMRASLSTTATTSSLVTIVNPTVDWDTHNAYNPATGIYTVPVPGKYRVSGAANFSPTTTTNTNHGIALYIYQNATSRGGTYFPWQVASVNLSPNPNYTTTMNCVPGDTITLRTQHNASVTDVSLDGTAGNNFCIERIGN